MSARLAIQLPPHQLDDLQRAARLLLRRPLICADDPAAFAAVRRWETVLRNEFNQKLGYRLDVTRSAVRLTRRAVSPSASRGARLPNGRPMSHWGYTYFALVLAALEAPGEQVLASELIERIEQRCRGDDVLSIDTTEFAQRRGFSDAVKVLVQLGVLTARDGDLDSLVDDAAVLFDIDRDAAGMCLVASPSVLRDITDVHDFVTEATPTSIDARRRAARHRLNRRLIDQPVVHLDDIDDDEAELAWRNRRREAENIARLTGCAIEVRAEGMALIDTTIEPLGAIRFPGGDSVAHASLLWLDAMLARLDATPGADGEDSDTRVDGDDDSDASATVSRRPLSQAAVDHAWYEVHGRYRTRFAAAARDDPARFRADCAALLASLDLVRPTSTGVEISPAAARYRPDVDVVDPAPPVDPTPDVSPAGQQELFS